MFSVFNVNKLNENNNQMICFKNYNFRFKKKTLNHIVEYQPCITDLV